MSNLSCLLQLVPTDGVLSLVPIALAVQLLEATAKHFGFRVGFLDQGREALDLLHIALARGTRNVKAEMAMATVKVSGSMLETTSINIGMSHVNVWHLRLSTFEL